MLVHQRHYHEAYAQILAASRAADWAGGAPSSVLLLVATDVDALAAAHMLVSLLTTDCVGYVVRPVSGWPDLERAFEEEIRGKEELRTVVLINLGASIDLYLDIEWPSRAQVHVIDSHRPHQWHNLWLQDAENIHVWDDGEVANNMKEEYEAFVGLRQDAIRKAERRRARGEASDAEDSESESDEDDEEGSAEKRIRLDEYGNALPARIPRRQIQAFAKRRDKYYSRGSWFGQSVAGQIYSLTTSLARGNNDLLWHAIVGLTFQFVASLIDAETYKSRFEVYADEVARLSSLEGQAARSQKANGPADRSIRPSEELRFTLQRHWTLYDAMLHSSYVAGKLKLWRERGKRNLNNLLAKMGFSLHQCHQTYTHMDMDLKQSLQQKIDTLAPEYGLEDLTYSSFMRASGYQSMLSASDVVESVGALLEAAHGVRLDFGDQNFMTWDAHRSATRSAADDLYADKENRNPTGAPAKAKDVSTQEAPVVAPEVQTTNNFWTAWEGLSADTRTLRTAIQLSMALHRSIIRQGCSLLDKQAIKPLQGYRLAILDEGPDLPVFAHPATLSRLALWLVDTVREVVVQVGTGPQRRELPFVVAALDEKRDIYLVVGVNGCAEYGDVRKNRFAVKFREAYDDVLDESENPDRDDRVRLERFESSIVEVRKDSIKVFLSKLNLLLATTK